MHGSDSGCPEDSMTTHWEVAFSYKHRFQWYWELHKLLAAGFPIRQALDSLGEKRWPSAVSDFIGEMAKTLDAGKSISEAFCDAAGSQVSDMEYRLIAAGEKGGQLSEVFLHLSEYYRQLKETRREIASQMIYPVIVLHLAALLPAIPRLLVSSSLIEALRPAFVVLACYYVGGAVLWFGYQYLAKLGAVQSGVDRILRCVPVVGRTRRLLSMERFCRVARIYLLAGLRPSQAVEAAGDASGSGLCAAACKEISRELAAGNPLASQLDSYPSVFPSDFTRSMATGEEAGTLDKETGWWAGYFQAESRRALEKLKFWLPKVLYVLIVLYVAYTIISFWSAHFQQYSDLDKYLNE